LKDNIIRVTDAEKECIINTRALNAFELKDLLNQFKNVLLFAKINNREIDINHAENFVKNLQILMIEREKETVRKLTKKSNRKKSVKNDDVNATNTKNTEKKTEPDADENMDIIGEDIESFEPIITKLKARSYKELFKSGNI